MAVDFLEITKLCKRIEHVFALLLINHITPVETTTVL